MENNSLSFQDTVLYILRYMDVGKEGAWGGIPAPFSEHTFEIWAKALFVIQKEETLDQIWANLIHFAMQIEVNHYLILDSDILLSTSFAPTLRTAVSWLLPQHERNNCSRASWNPLHI